MSLSSLYLDAFAEVARQKSFSQAAKKLNITQSALSQRVINLEQEIGSSLFVREPSGVLLTELGQRLLRYCQSKESLEDEFLAHLKAPNEKSLSGLVRIASFSSITRSLILPVLSDLVKDHPGVRMDIRIGEIRDLPGLLSTGATDFIFGNQPLEKNGVENHHLGNEENVVVQASGKKVREDVYLDHDEEDRTTFDFFKSQGRKTLEFKRDYFDEIETILEAVRLGIGRAVVPVHLIKGIKGIEAVSGFKSQKSPVYLSYYTQAFYPALHQELIGRFQEEISGYLER
jgi:DNA-binding transcriptional LysR family regulator